MPQSPYSAASGSQASDSRHLILRHMVFQHNTTHVLHALALDRHLEKICFIQWFLAIVGSLSLMLCASCEKTNDPIQRPANSEDSKETRSQKEPLSTEKTIAETNVEVNATSSAQTTQTAAASSAETRKDVDVSEQAQRPANSGVPRSTSSATGAPTLLPTAASSLLDPMPTFLPTAFPNPFPAPMQPSQR